MKKIIHYLINDPNNLNGLIYPNEVDENYYTQGSLYIIGNEPLNIFNTYSCLAVRYENIIELNLTTFNHYNFLQSNIEGIGNFIFYVEAVFPRKKYTGNYSNGNTFYGIKRLRAWNRQIFDAACREHNFYFVGYSPIIDSEI